MVTSTPPRTGPNTRIPAAVGRVTKAEVGTTSRNPADQVPDGVENKRAAVHPPSVAEAGIPGLQAVAVGRAVVAAADGVATAAAVSAGSSRLHVAQVWRAALVKRCTVIILEDRYVGQDPQNCCHKLDASRAHHFSCRLHQSREACGQSFCFSRRGWECVAGGGEVR